MANLKSSLKDIRRIATRTARNRQIKSRIKTLHKAVDASLAAGDAEKAKVVVADYISAVDKAAKSGVLHPNKVNREKSKMSAKLTALSA